MRILLFLLAGLLGCSKVPHDRQELVTPAVSAQMEGLWVLQIRRQHWKPRDLEFVLRVEPHGDGSRGTATVDPVFIGRTTATMSEFAADGDRVQFVLRSKWDDVEYRFRGQRDGGTLDGVVRWHDGKRTQADPFSGFSRQVRRFDVDIDRFPVETDPAAVGVEPVLLDRLVLGAEGARSDSIMVLSEGKLIAARTFGNEDRSSTVRALDTDIVKLVPVRRSPDRFMPRAQSGRRHVR